MKKILSIIVTITICLSFSSCSNKSTNKKVALKAQIEENESEKTKESLVSNTWYVTSNQDEIVTEWIFYDDNTCTSETKNIGGTQKTDARWATYQIENSIISIHPQDQIYIIKWYYEKENDCIWEYFQTNKSLKQEVIKYDAPVDQLKIDEMINNHRSRIYYKEFDEKDLDIYYQVFPMMKKDFNTINKETSESREEEIITTLVEKWDSLMNSGFCCDYEMKYEDMRPYLPEKLKELDPIVYEITCCKSVEEIKEHAKMYISSKLVDEYYYDSFFLHDGKIYYARGAKGSFSHNLNSITYQKTDKNTYEVTAKLEYAWGEVDSFFTIKKIDGKLMITDHSESEPTYNN